MTGKCEAVFHRCICGLDEHSADIAHECQEPDPQCGGSWRDDPTDPTRVVIVRYPGIRKGGPNVKFALEEGLVDPNPDGAPVVEDRDDPSVVRASRGGIRYYRADGTPIIPPIETTGREVRLLDAPTVDAEP